MGRSFNALRAVCLTAAFLGLAGCPTEAADEAGEEAPAATRPAATQPTTMPADKFAMLDDPEMTRVLFYPRRAARVASTNAHRSVRFRVADDVELAGRLHVASAEAPVILLWHGNGEVATDYENIAPMYTQLGITLLVVDYRGYGDSGGKPSASTLVSDATAVWRQLPDVLKKNELRPKRLFVMGRSLGSVPAIEIAARAETRLAGLVVESGFANTLPLIRVLGGRVPPGATEAKHGFGNLTKMEAVRIPALILHGQADTLIPVFEAQALHKACPAEQKRLVTIPRANHNSLLYHGRRAYFAAIREFVFD